MLDLAPQNAASSNFRKKSRSKSHAQNNYQNIRKTTEELNDMLLSPTNNNK